MKNNRNSSLFSTCNGCQFKRYYSAIINYDENSLDVLIDLTACQKVL